MNGAPYIRLVQRWLMMAALPAIAVTGIAYAYFLAQPRTYGTTVVLYVQQPSSDATAPASTDVQTSRELIPTYSEMIQTPVIQDSVNRAMAVKYPGYRLQDHDLTVSRAGVLPGIGQEDTQLMDISVSDTVPARAADSANTLADAFIGRIADIQRLRFRGGGQTLHRQLARAQSTIQDVSRRIQTYSGPPEGRDSLRAEMNAYGAIFQTLLASQQEFNMARHIALNSVRVFSPAPVPTVPTGPHPARSALLWGFMAIVASTGVVLVLDHLDDTPRSPDEVEELLDAPILGVVPAFRAGKAGKSLLITGELPPVAEEAYLAIRTSIGFMDVEGPVRTVLITSPRVGDGKSVTAGNLACAFAAGGKRVALVDADLRRPTLHQNFGLDRRVGLTTVLAGREDPDERAGYAQPVPNLSVITSGPLPLRPPDVLSSTHMRRFLEYLRGEADIVFIDSPPVLAVTDAVVLSAIVDGVVLVVDTAVSTRRDILRARNAFEAVGGHVLGVVINRAGRSGERSYRAYYTQRAEREWSDPLTREPEPHSVET